MKKKVIKSYENLSPEIKAALIKEYPYGFEDKISSIQDVIKGGYFKGMIFDYEDVTYLIKFKNEAEYSGEPLDEDEDYDSEGHEGFDAEEIPDEDFDD